MFGHDVVHPGQAQTGALEPPDDIAGAITAFEDPRQLRGRNANAPSATLTTAQASACCTVTITGRS